MILIEEATVQCAVEALKAVRRNMLDNAPHLSGKVWGLAERAITAIDEALAAPQPAQPSQRHPLTRQQINKMDEGGDFSGNIYEITRAVEIEHGIGTKP